VTKQEADLLVATRRALADGSAKRRRATARLSQTEMAARCRVGQPTVSGWENNHRTPGTRDALAYGRALAAAERKAA
jgi:transcriptional regulator with XRE-family HTH domain